MTGFYENLWVEGIVFGEDDIPDFETKYHIWWKVENAPFDMYCAQNKEALWWNPAIYCKKSQFDTVKNYYEDADNLIIMRDCTATAIKTAAFSWTGI